MLVGIDEKDERIPEEFVLEQNYPNPFNPITTIRYGLPESSPVKLTVYDLAGRKIKTLVDTDKPAGWHSVTWDGTDDSGISVSTGVYLYIIHTKNYTVTKKMLYMK